MGRIRYRLVTVVALSLALASSLALAQPANDSCAGAVIVTGLPFNYAQNSRLATVDPNDPILACADSGGGKTVWFVFTPDSTQYVEFSTAASTPADYDIALGLYTGSCGALTFVDCADDINPGTVRQAIIGYEVQAGVTYYLHVAEWNGGGPSGGVPTGGDLVLDVYASSPAPIYAGPKSGSVAGGATVILSVLGAQNVPAGVKGEADEAAENRGGVLYPPPADVMPPLGPEGSNFRQDPSLKSPQDRLSEAAASAQPVVLKNFKGNTATGFIPPDPIVAAGPNHVIGMVNSAFMVWDKDGNLLESRSLNTWFGNVASPLSFSDPQIHYDHFANRWIVAGGNFAEPYSILISVSDDDDPYGTWYNWSLPGGLGDSATGNLPDYPQIGYDSLAIYVTTRDFGASDFYSRVRIIEKTQLLNNDAGPVTWTDFWDLREPDHPIIVLDGIRPSIQYGSPGVHFMVNASPYNPGTFFTIWTIHDPVGTPTITAENVPVVEYNSPANASQPGGGVALEAGGAAIRHKAVYRDSSLWMVHTIASGTGNAYSAVRYVRVNPHTATNLEDEAMGGDGFWHIYPAIMADAEHNIAITYTRSGVSEYPGAFVAGHKDTDPPGITPSVALFEGAAHYEAVGGGRNRWGDYMGIAMDPADSMAFWVNTEFSVSEDNWETRVAMLKMGPLPGAYINSDATNLTFGTIEVTDTSTVRVFTLVNNGIDTLTIPSVDLPDSNFFLEDPPSFPIALATFEVETLRVKFAPEVRGNFTDSLVVNSNDAIRPALRVTLLGNGFIVDPAVSGTMYSSSGTGDAGRLRTVDPVDASSSPVGPSGFNQLINIRVRNSTGELLGLATNSATNAPDYDIVRVNASLGDAHMIANIPLGFLKGMTFRDDTMYVARITGGIYSIDLNTGTPTLVASTGKALSAIDVNPVTGELWAAVKSGSPIDGIYKIALPSGTPTLVGTTGFGVPTVDLAFDASGNLFALVGTPPASSELALLDTVTGGGTKIGPLGISTGQAIAFHPDVTNFATTYRLFQKWNLLSLPVEVPEPTPSGVFPSSLLASKAYGYDGGYVAADTLRPRIGYWVKMTSAKPHSIIGTPDSTDTVALADKWNIVASNSFIAPLSGVTTDPPGILMTQFYAYDDTGYVIPDSLVPGRGYWVRASAPGTLHLNAPTSMPSGAPKGSPADAFAGLNLLRIEDAAGRGQTLRFGRPDGSSPPAELYELPPPPPEAGFDARFGSGSMVGYNEAGSGAEGSLPLRIVTDRYPLTLRWIVHDDAGAEYALAWPAAPGGSGASSKITGEGSLTLTEAQARGLLLVMGSREVPTEYALAQNYPNPFNPTTTVEYALPRAERVRIVLYNTIGEEVSVVIDAEQDAGYHSALVKAENLASGVYFYKLTAGSYTASRKMLLLR